MSNHPPRTELGDIDVYRSIVEGIPALLYIDKPDELSTNFYTSPYAVELLGYTAEEWGTTQDLWLRLIHPDDRERVVAENNRSNEVGDRFSSEYRMFARDGRIVWIRDEAVPVADSAGEIAYWRGVMLDVTPQKEAEEKLRWSLETLRRTIQQRRELAQRLENAQEEERRRIAADIHDDPIQIMSAVDMRLAMLAQTTTSIAPRELLELQEIVRLSIERLRSLLFELRPGALDREGLVVALRQYLEHSAAETGWKHEVNDGLRNEPGPELRATLYRIAQEAVANARKHAGATQVEVDVATAGDGFTVRVRDDGTGFDPQTEPEPGHLGLSTMFERAELIGGWCRITSSRGAGTIVECWLPSDGADAADVLRTGPA